MANTIGIINDIKGFFTTYSEENGADFSTLFPNAGESDITALDYLLSDVHGNRPLTAKYSKLFDDKGAGETMKRIVLLCDKMYFDSWVASQKAIADSLNQSVATPFKSKRKYDSKRKGDSESERQDQLNAFDGETASDTSSTATTGETNNTINDVETKEYTNGRLAVQNAGDVIDFTRNNEFLEIMLNDIVGFCCVGMWDSCERCGDSQGGGGGGSYDDTELRNRITQAESDIDGIESLIPSNASTANKLATIADIGGGGGGSYDDTELRNRITQAETDIGTLETALDGKATTASVTALTGRVTQAETDIDGIESLIPSNATTTNKLATIADIGGGGGGSYDDTELRNRITQAETDIDTLETALDGKATTASVTALTGRVTQAETDIDTLETALDGKATTASVTALTGRVTQAETDIDGIESLIPSNATTTNKLATIADIGGGTWEDITGLTATSAVTDYIAKKNGNLVYVCLKVSLTTTGASAIVLKGLPKPLVTAGEFVPLTCGNTTEVTFAGVKWGGTTGDYGGIQTKLRCNSGDPITKTIQGFYLTDS